MTPPSVPAPPRSQTWACYRCLVGLGTVCATGIVAVRALTQPIVLQQRLERRVGAVLSVLPDSVSSQAFEPIESGGFAKVTASAHNSGQHVYAGYSAAGELVGLAIQASGMGYQDTIELLYGYDPASETIVGLRVLASRETPGLGDKIEKDPQFLENFRSLDVKLSDTGGLLHPIESVEAGKKIDPWQVDAITGATVSSRAVASILRTSTNRWLDTLKAHAQEFQQ